MGKTYAASRYVLRMACDMFIPETNASRGTSYYSRTLADIEESSSSHQCIIQPEGLVRQPHIDSCNKCNHGDYE